MLKPLKSYLKSVFNFHDQKKQLLTLVLASFLISFITARVYSWLFITHVVYFRGYHIHHFYYGALALSLGGLLSIISRQKKWLQISSVLIGTGIGLFGDEIGLLLNCTTSGLTCGYAFPDTYDIIGTICVSIIVILIAVDAFEKSANKKNGGNGAKPAARP